MVVLSSFAGFALLLTAIGIYGLMACSVQRRYHEIGIRLALGAEAANVRNMVILQGLRLALIGFAIGVVGAAATTRLIKDFLYGVGASDPVIFISVPVVLAVVTLVAVWLPARRAIGIDPIVTLRTE
jgi:ABC-type antimicrobial peptide transport system permease subunit